ncbi:MAG TPA: alpha/beta hydrolase [Actinomycetota bacterium]|nr:alpha/beta hydrolase [Actinomycetota bacterium]
MRGRRRFLAYGIGALAAGAAAGRLVTRRDTRRPDPALDDALGSLRGEPRMIRGPRASRLYTETFPGPGTLVFTHGYCLTEAVWHYQKRHLAGRFGVVTWDLPGHGHSPGLAPGRLSLEFCADAMARVIDEAADGSVVLVGHSLGGVIALAYLARHPETAAERVRGAVLVSTPMTHLARAVAGRWPGGALESRVVGRTLQYVVQSDLAERVLGRDVGRRDLSLSYRVVRWGFGRDPSPSHVLFVRDAIASVRPDVRAETHRVMSDAHVEGFLPNVAVPTLVMFGGRDRLVDPDESRAMADLLPRGRTIAFPEAGHAVFLEDHEGFNAELGRFAARRLVPAA